MSEQTTLPLSSITAVITGGSSGLGFATAQHLLQRGATVALFDIDREKGEKAVREAGGNAHFYPVNVCSEDEVSDALQAFREKAGRINLCVSCAGIAPAARTLDKSGNAASFDQFRKVTDINLNGTFNVSRLAAQTMAAQEADENGERGVIINTASIAGYEGQTGQTAYAASKAGIIGMTLPMARDLAAVGIRVNAIAPGVMGTPMLLAMPEHVQAALSANVPFPKRLGLPEEFAALVAHIALNTYINGETIRLDGALRMPPK